MCVGIENEGCVWVHRCMNNFLLIPVFILTLLLLCNTIAAYLDKAQQLLSLEYNVRKRKPKGERDFKLTPQKKQKTSSFTATIDALIPIGWNPKGSGAMWMISGSNK